MVEGSGGQLTLARVLTNLSHTYTGLGQHEEAIAVARRGQEVVQTIGLMRTLGPVLAGNLADPLVSLGRLDEASAVIADAAALTPDTYSGAAYLKQLSGWLTYIRGDIDATEAILHELDQDFPNIRLLPQDELPAIRLRAMVKLSRGDAVSAFDEAAEPLRHERSAGHSRYLWPLTVASRTCPRAAAGAAARYEARESTAALLREANELACGMGSGLLCDEIAELARRARVELTTADHNSAAQPPAVPPGQPPELARLGLTDREIEVLRGVAAGQTNRQIADSLFMSPKTASVHVSNILAKLNVRSRGEAAALAHRLRLFDDL